MASLQWCFLQPWQNYNHMNDNFNAHWSEVKPKLRFNIETSTGHYPSDGALFSSSDGNPMVQSPKFWSHLRIVQHQHQHASSACLVFTILIFYTRCRISLEPLAKSIVCHKGFLNCNKSGSLFLSNFFSNYSKPGFTSIIVSMQRWLREEKDVWDVYSHRIYSLGFKFRGFFTGVRTLFGRWDLAIRRQRRKRSWTFYCLYIHVLFGRLSVI